MFFNEDFVFYAAKVGDTVQLRGNTKSLMQKFETSTTLNKEERDKKRNHIVKEIQATEINYLMLIVSAVSEFTCDVL